MHTSRARGVIASLVGCSARSGARPFDIPARPDQIYRGHGWDNWPDWLGSMVIARRGKMLKWGSGACGSLGLCGAHPTLVPRRKASETDPAASNPVGDQRACVCVCVYGHL